MTQEKDEVEMEEKEFTIEDIMKEGWMDNTRKTERLENVTRQKE